MNNKYLIREIIQMVMLLVVTAFLSYILSSTNDLIAKTIVIVFIILFIITFLRRLFLILNQNQLAELFSKFSTIIFFIYWFGFLIYWDYISISKNEYISVLFSIPLLFTGIFMVYREFKRK